ESRIHRLPNRERNQARSRLTLRKSSLHMISAAAATEAHGEFQRGRSYRPGDSKPVRHDDRRARHSEVGLRVQAERGVLHVEYDLSVRAPLVAARWADNLVELWTRGAVLPAAVTR